MWSPMVHVYEVRRGDRIRSHAWSKGSLKGIQGIPRVGRAFGGISPSRIPEAWSGLARGLSFVVASAILTPSLRGISDGRASVGLP